MEKALIVDADKCTGCMICELICSLSRQGETNPSKSFIRVMRNRELDVNIPMLSVECNFCGECIASCPQNALKLVTLAEAAVIRKGQKIGSFPAPLLGRVTN